MIPLIAINSPASAFSNDIKAEEIRNKITKEFLFFDKSYWEAKNQACIDICLSGDGYVGYLLCG